MTLRRAALAAVAAALFLASWVLLHHGWWGGFAIVDTPVYQQYGDAMAAGKVPYRDFALEYPPGALAAFAAPELTARRGDLGSYAHAYERWLAGCGVAMVLLLALARARPAALALAAVSPLLLGNIVLSRFDLWPAALTAGALAALLAGWELTSAAVLAAAVAAKLYPLVIVPVALAWVWRRRGGRAAAAWSGVFVGVLAAVFVPFAVLSPGGLAQSFATQLSRPVQVESLPAAFVVLAHHLGGLGLTVVSDHGSQNFEGSAANWAGAVATGLQLAVLGSVWLAFARGPATRARLATAAAGSVVAFVAFGKVFSPQYLIWLVPLVALVRARAAWALLAGALVLTQVWFPDRYWQLALEQPPLESSLLVLRDLVAVALALVLLRALSEYERLGERRPFRKPLEPVGREVEV